MKQLCAFWRGRVAAVRFASALPLLPVLLAAFSGHAAVVNWTNVSGGLWSAATNWSSNTVPAVASDVYISAAGTYTVTQDVHVTIGSLTLGGESGTQMLTNAFANLTLNGTSTVQLIRICFCAPRVISAARVIEAG